MKHRLKDGGTYFIQGDFENIRPVVLPAFCYRLVMGRTPFYRTSNELKHVPLLVIELKPPNFGFKQSNIELRT